MEFSLIEIQIIYGPNQESIWVKLNENDERQACQRAENVLRQHTGPHVSFIVHRAHTDIQKDRIGTYLSGVVMEMTHDLQENL